MPNLDTTGHQWVAALALFQFELEYQKGANNSTSDALSQVPISHSWESIQSLLEGVIVGVADWGEVRASEELLEEHECLSQEVRVQAAKLAPRPRRQTLPWPHATSGFISGGTRRFQSRMPFSRSVLEWRLRWNRARCSSVSAIVLNKGLMYVTTTPKGETEGVLAFVVPVGQHHKALNGVHHDASHQGQQRTLALTQKRFWWPMMAED